MRCSALIRTLTPQQSKKHIEPWERNIIRMQTRAIKMQRRSSKNFQKPMLYLVTQKRNKNTTNSVMRHSTAVQEPVDSVALISVEWISQISLAIFSVICLVAAVVPDVLTMDRCKVQMFAKGFASHLRKQSSDAKKNWKLLSRIHVQPAVETELNREQHRRPARNVMDVAKWYIPHNPSLERCRTYRPVQNVMVRVKSFVKNVLTVEEVDMWLLRRKYLLQFLQVLTMVKAFASVKRVSRESTVVQEVICL